MLFVVEAAMTLTTFLLQTLLALALGSFIGLERQWHRRLVDLKTNALVCMGAALFMMVSASPNGPVEPIRMAAQIVVGVGFIGGGLLFRDGTQTRGINTAATLWCSAAIGTLCGMGRAAEASLAAGVLVAANIALRGVARGLQLRMGLNDSLTEQLSFEVECEADQTSSVRDALEAALLQRHGELRSVSETRTGRGTTQLTVSAAFESTDLRADIDAVLTAAEAWRIVSVSWRRQ
jgi:putative Mg2+ transporter-C (MgtC) family protein